MALDPLRFAIEIADEASQKIKAIKEELNKLEPKIKVTFDESSINVAQLRTALENAIKSLGEIKVSGAGINISGDALGGAADKITEAKEAIKGGRFGELAKRINEATTELERLTKAFEVFQLTIGKDKGLKDFMTGLGEVISNVKTQLGALDKVSNSETSLTKTAEKVETNRRKFNELIEAAGRLKTELKSVNIDAVGAGFDNPVLKNALRNIDEYINGLRRMREEGKVDFSSNHQISEMVAGFNRLKSALSDVGQWQSKLTKSAISEGLRADAQSAAEATRLFAQWSESIRRASVEYTDLGIKIAQLSDKEKAASAVGVDTTKLKDQINALKVYRDTLKEISDGSRKHGTAQEFVRRADYETAIKLAQREGEVVMQTARERARADKQLEQSIKQAEDNQNRFNRALFEAQEMMKRLTSASSTGAGLNLGTGEIDKAIIKLRQYIDQLLLMDAAQFNATGMAGWKNLSQQLAVVAREQEKLNKATDTANQKSAAEATRQQAQAAKQAQTDTEKWAESMRVASIEATKLEREIRELKKVEKKGSDLGIDTTNLKSRITQLEQMAQILRSIEAGMRIHGTASSYINSADFKNAVLLANEEKTAIAAATREKEKAASATSQLTAEEQRLAQALNQTTEHARGQSQVLSDLKSMAMQYLGVWGGQQFLHNIIEIGGQLEMQRLSIGAILQNQGQANDLFEKIKGLAMQSPFGVVELDQMTKQLTAYGFKYNELFDMTKRLADISAATGTSVDRLALALGHVRSEAALSGYTLRQFSMANVPLLAKLSEKLGKTTQEIRKMVRAKEVSYEDVVGVLKDITNEGGMFYQMQEVISSSVKAKFKNVKDAMDIMYGEMAEGYIGDSLKGVADALMEVTRNWKDAATVLGTGAALWAAQRVAVMAYTAAIGKNTAATFSSIAANTEKQGAMLRLANQYRVLTTAERDLMNASKANSAMIRLRTMLGMNYTKAQGTYIAAQRIIITNTLTQSLSEGKLTVAELAHMVAVRKLSHEEARLIIINSTLDASLKEQALSIIGSVTQLGRLEIAFMRLGAVMRSIGSMALSFLPMAAITALIELWQHNKREMESAEEMANNVYEASKNATEATQRMMKETSIQKIDVNGSLAADNLQMPEFDKDTAESVMEQWTQYIREYAGTPNKLINDALTSQADGVSSLADQYNKLGDAVKVVIEAQQKLGDFSDVFAAAQKGTDSGWFDDDVANDVKQYIATRKSLRQEIGKYYQENMKNVDRGIKKAREQDEAFRKNTEGMRSEAEMLVYLTENWGHYQDAIRAFGSETGENTDWIKRLGNNLRSQKSEMDVELRRYYAGLQQGLLASGENLDALSPSSQQMLIKGFKMFLDSLGNMSEQEYKERLDNFKKYFKITLDDAEENAQKTLTDWQRRAQDVFTVNSTIKVKSKTITDKDEFAQAVQKDLKEKQEYVDRNTKPIKQLFRIQPNIKFDTEYLSKYIKAISDQIFKLTESGQKEAAGILMSQLNDELLPYYNALRSLEEDEKWLKQEGYPKSDKESKSKNKSKSGAGGKEDKNAKAVRERVRILKEAADAFEYWNKKLGPTGAWERVNEQFGDVLSKIGVTIDNIEDLRGHLKAVSNSKEYKAIKDQKVKLEIDKEIAKDLDQLNRKVFEKSIDEYKSKFTKTLDDLTRRWETFNAVRQATGSKAIALDLAGISEQDRDLRNAADAMRKKLVEEMRNAGGDSLVTAIPLDVYVDEEKLRDQFKAALGDNDEQAKKIDGLVEAYKRWQKAQQDVTKADIDAYAKIIGSVVDYASRIDRINDKLEQEKENIEALVALYNKSGGKEGISQDAADAANAILTANTNFGKLKEGSDYINLMNRSLSMTKGEVTAAASAIEDSLNERLAVGVIKAEEYATEIKKLHDIVAKFDENSLFGSNSALTSFLSGGLKGSQSFVNDRIVSLTIKSNQEGLSEDEQNELDSLIELRKKLDSAISKLSGFAVALQVVTGALDGFHKAAQSLSEMFDALGKEGPASFWGDIADGISAVSSIFEPANNLVQNALSGNIGGVLSSAISAPVDMITGPITAFAKLHDKRLERAIERLRDDVKSIEANTELIVRSRERTLGYDMGDVRRQMAQQYATPSYKGGGIAALIAAALGGSQQNKSMYDYYMNNSQGTGYQQEYDNLVEQREKYMEILKDQQDKKKKSNEEIEETKSKIAELDDQIRYFSQDLAKELWGIDIKGWADQLSDALASAFENGENMAKAYRETVTSILQQMMQKMMQMQILEPMFANLQKDLFGENGKGGVFDPNNPKGSLSKVTKIIGDYFGKGGEGEKAITASMEFMTAFQRGMQSAGLTVLNEASNTLSSGIQGTTEETSDLLAGYVNALRQDVSVNRILLTQYVTQLWPQYIEAYTAQVTSVSNIDNNVRVIMEMMQLGNGAMYERISNISSRIDNIVMGIDRVSIR